MTRLEEDSAHDKVQADADALALPRSPASSGCHPPNESSRIGICVSGGGIRAAAFGLGALQVLQTKGVLARAKYISAVSGGSYIVGALAIMVGRNRPAGSGAVASQTYGKSWDSELPGGDSQAAFAHGSPEERYLRSHLDYLTTGPGGMAGVIGRAVFGFLLNLFFFSLTRASAHIILVKAGVTNDGPWDIRSYYSRNPGFPADSTLDQLYRSTRFDAYRALGEYSTREAFEAVGQRALT